VAAQALLCVSSACTRPAATCTPATPAALNALSVIESISDIAFDQSCNAYLTTVFAGRDHGYMVTPASVVTNWAYPADDTDGHFIAVNPSASAIWATWQDVQWGLAEVVTNAMTLRVTGASTIGVGPWTNAFLDEGPAGLTVDADGTAYVGNVTTNGQVQKVTTAGVPTLLGVGCTTRDIGLARGAGSDLWMACLNQNTVVRGNVTTGTSTVFSSTTAAPQSLAFDALTGNLFVQTSDGAITLLDTVGMAAPVAFATATGDGLITVGPDDALWRIAYVLNASSTVTRYPLPKSP
jgi:hypothetical protein